MSVNESIDMIEEMPMKTLFIIALALVFVYDQVHGDIMPDGFKAVSFRVRFVNVDSFPQFVFVGHLQYGTRYERHELHRVSSSTKLTCSGRYRIMTFYVIDRTAFEKLNLVFEPKGYADIARFPFDTSSSIVIRRENDLDASVQRYLRSNGFHRLSVDTVIHPTSIIPISSELVEIIQEIRLDRKLEHFTGHHVRYVFEYENGAVVSTWIPSGLAPTPDGKKQIPYFCSIENPHAFPGYRFYGVEFAKDTLRRPMFRILASSDDQVTTAEIFATQDTSAPEADDYFKVRRSYSSLAAGWDWLFFSDRSETRNLVDSTHQISERTDRIRIRTMKPLEYETEVTLLYADGREEVRTYLAGSTYEKPVEIPTAPRLRPTIPIIAAAVSLVLLIGIWIWRRRKSQ